MFRNLRMIIAGVAICALVSASTNCYAATIIKLSLGGDATSDIEYSGGVGGILSTADDTIVSAGEQNTAVEYLDFLDSVATDIVTPTASFTLDGLVATGSAVVFAPSLVVQNFSGGMLSLYDAADNLLLEGTLGTSALSGSLGPPGTGGLFTTSFNVITDGSLAPYIDPTSLTLSMTLSDINGGAGLSVTPPPPGIFMPPAFHLGVLNMFTADATVEMDGERIPEPASIALLLMGGALALTSMLRNQR